ncbi:MAG TPA: precorrin-6Y C5,15-methyltransferase (decarboxylating) subunit CbiT [Dehalococcoidia bacterium]|nr:precorrin-6Y C5,15-methyltransferase (decarboxylating) subunit CbiT [Dehalococcoidia bacterium]|tara:strand:- start:210 stop:812 length:603 start_codon:yes stop_codon:yes gene_type:complete
MTDELLIPYGVSDDRFLQRKAAKGQITKREIRALSISFLKLLKSSVVWDIGSATGSIAIEASKIAYEGQIYAIEKDLEHMHLLETNIRKHSAKNVSVISGEAPCALRALPRPDSVFIGGHGGLLEEIIDCAISELKDNGSIVLNFASVERSVRAYNILKDANMVPDYLSVNISRGRELADKSLVLSPINPIFIVSGVKTK